MFNPINNGVIFSIILAFSKIPQSIVLIPGILLIISAAISLDSLSSPAIKQSQSISSGMFARCEFEILQNASDKNKMESVLKKDPAFKKIDRETAAAINLFAGMNLKINEKDEVVDVCKAWEEQKECGKMEMLYSLVQDGTLKADKAADKANLTVT